MLGQINIKPPSSVTGRLNLMKGGEVLTVIYEGVITVSALSSRLSVRPRTSRKVMGNGMKHYNQRNCKDISGMEF